VRPGCPPPVVLTGVPGFDQHADPELNSPVQFPNEDAFGRTISKSSTTFIAFVGSCLECSVKDFEFAKLPTKSYEQVIVLFDGAGGEVPKSLFSLPQNCRIVSNAALTKRLNCGWPGRYYEVADGKLINFQLDPDVVPLFEDGKDQ
jgi:hypothetical protein